MLTQNQNVQNTEEIIDIFIEPSQQNENNGNENADSIKNLNSEKHKLNIKKFLPVLVIVFAVFLIFNLIGDKNKKDIENKIDAELEYIIETNGIENAKIKYKYIDKNKEEDLYIYDVVLKGKDDGEKFEDKAIMIFYCDGYSVSTFDTIEYIDSSRNEAIEYAQYYIGNE